MRRRREAPTQAQQGLGETWCLALQGWTQDTGPAKALNPLCTRGETHLCSLSFSICELGIMSLSCQPHKEDEPKLTSAD